MSAPAADGDVGMSVSAEREAAAAAGKGHRRRKATRAAETGAGSDSNEDAGLNRGSDSLDSSDEGEQDVRKPFLRSGVVGVARRVWTFGWLGDVFFCFVCLSASIDTS